MVEIKKVKTMRRPGKSFTALNIISYSFTVGGVVFIAVWLFSMTMILKQPEQTLDNVAVLGKSLAVIVSTLFHFVCSITCFAFGELIRLALEIEKNTRYR